MEQLGQHWTSRSTDDFLYSIAAGFVRQLEQAMEDAGISQADLARALNVSSGRVSQILNNPGNLTLKNMIRCSAAVGHKLAVVSYDDNDPDNLSGLVGAEIFTTCWERAGKPRDFFALRESRGQAMNTIGMIGDRFVTSTATTPIGRDDLMVSVEIASNDASWIEGT